jgi:hypothetical protein
MKRKKTTRKPKIQTGPGKRVWDMARDVYDEFRDERVESRKVSEVVMKRLGLPTSNPTAVWMMEYCAIEISGAVARHYFAPEAEKDSTQGVLSAEFSPRLQDAYAIPNEGTVFRVPRSQLTLAEMQYVVKKLKTIGSGYLEHAAALEKEMRARFPKEAAS